jgi:uncharacterized delta-60 repeat protein
VANPESKRTPLAPLCLALFACGGDVLLVRPVPATDAGTPIEGGLDLEGGSSVESSSVDALGGVSLDPSFGMAGCVTGALAAWRPVGITLDSEGRLIVSGPSGGVSSPPAETVLRLTSSGAFDMIFGASGSATLPVDSDALRQAVKSLSNGRIGVFGAAGPSSSDSQPGAFAARLNADGSVDTTFADQSALLTASGAFSWGLWQDDGSGLVFGSTAVLRVAATGQVDTTYASGGTIPPATTGVFTPSGRLLTGNASRVARYLASGALDTSFGQGGLVTLTLGGEESPTIQSLLIDQVENVLVVASHPTGASYAIDLFRLTSSGSTDTTFASNGVASLPTIGGPVGAAPLPQGPILIWTSYGEVLELSPTGQSLEGMWDLQVQGAVLAAALDAQQRLVVVGVSTTDPLNESWFVRRYFMVL